MSTEQADAHNDKIRAADKQREFAKTGTVASRKAAKRAAEAEASRFTNLAARKADADAFKKQERERRIREFQQRFQAADVGEDDAVAVDNDAEDDVAA